MAGSALVSWSGGKDSCMALYEILNARRFEVAALLTTMTRERDSISMHGVRRVLLERQARSLGLSLHQVYLTRGATNEEYEAMMEEELAPYREDQVTSMVFGDLFLEDIKEYRDRLMTRLGFEGVYPLWRRDTSELIKEFMALGFRAIAVCVNPEALDKSFLGRMIDDDFLSDLPNEVDPCGENGEFHTFVFDGPMFREEIKFARGEVTLIDSHYFCDLIPD